MLIERYNCGTSPELRLVRMLDANAIDLVVDVGANAGYFAKEIREAGYRGAILSFEPLADAHASLLAAARHDSAWHVASRCAIGAVDSTVEVNVAGNSTSSSILPMLGEHVRAAPNSAYVRKERVPLCRLDTFEHASLSHATRPFLKIDTQGYEQQVLDGAAGILSRVHGIQVEMTLSALYEGQQLWLEMHAQLQSLGFELWGVVPGFFDPATGRLFQFDGVYFRSEPATSA